MVEPNLKVFRLNYSGSFEEISAALGLNMFTLVDILAIYVPIQKRMYIWVGKNVTQSLRNYIPEIRTRFSEKLPELKILRNITVESGTEPSDFFKFLDFNWEKLNSYIKDQEEKLKPILQDLVKLKSQLSNIVKMENYEEAITISERIIQLAKELKDPALENEQETYINELKEKIKLKTSVNKIDEDTDTVAKKFDSLIKTNKPTDIIEAHELVNDFKKKYQVTVDLKTIPSALELITRAENIWFNFIKDQKTITKDLEQLEAKLNKAMEIKDVSEADDLILKSKDLILQISDDIVRRKWNETENNFIEWKNKNVIIVKIEQTIEECNKLRDNYDFEQAISKIDSSLSLIQDKEIIEYSNRLKDIRKDLLNAEENYIKNRERIAVLEERVKDNRRNNHLTAALTNCEKLIQIAEKIKKHDLVLTYNELLEEIKARIQKLEKDKIHEIQLLEKTARELDGVIVVDNEYIMPLMEEFAVKDILGDLSDDANEILNQVSTLLNEHRVEIKEDLLNKTVLKSSSGDIMELNKELKIHSKKDASKIPEYKVQTGFNNPFDDIIDEAIITDLIPYNYEITQIKLNDTIVKELPDKTRTKDGLELKWQIKEIKPKKKIEINYDLRRRVSRTIIFILEERLKIIKTHSNLEKLTIEGLYEANIPFTNSFGKPLNGVIVEDIIPLYYLHLIKEPSNLLPDKTLSSKQGDLIKWNIGTMSVETLTYQYRLLELYKLEEIKIAMNELSKNGINAINVGDLTDAIDIYDKIINTLNEFNQ